MVGAPYWVVARLCFIAERHWAAIDGEAASRGVDYLTLPVDRFCNTIYWWVAQRVKDFDSFKYDLERPPSGVAATAEELDAEAADFMAFASAFGVAPSVPAPPIAPVVESPTSATEG